MSQADPIQIIDDVRIVEPENGSDGTLVIEPEIVDAENLIPAGSPCMSCGAPHDPGDRFCPSCGAVSETTDNIDKDYVDESRKYINCKSCGSTIATDPQKRSYRCGFCDSTYVVEHAPEKTGRQRPEFIIGFAVNYDQAKEKFKHWIKDNGWFHPSDLKAIDLPEKITGIYLPFWSFSMLAESQWNANIGEHWYRTETYTTTDSKGKVVTRTRTVTETEWWPLAGYFHHYYSGYLASASHGLPQDVAEKIMPFDLPALKRYEPYFLAGWESEEYTVSRERALDVSQLYYQQCQEKNVAQFMPGDTRRGLQVQTNFSKINSDLCLLPYYLLTYRYKENLYRFLINGQTGRVWGSKPYSKTRIGAFVGGILLLLAAIVGIVILLAAIFGG